MSHQSSNSGEFIKGMFIGTVVGGIAGAITALLLAPKSGQELRRDISEKSQEIYDKATDLFQSVEGKVGSVVHTSINEGKIKAQNIVDSARRQAEDLLSNAENVLKDARTKASNAKDTITEKISNVRDAAKAGADAFRTEMKSSNEEF